MNDSVTIKPVAPPQEVIDEMAEAMQKELNKEA
jgi:regulator of protease activity HflC (stomatin/prohibitin superfamily)